MKMTIAAALALVLHICLSALPAQAQSSASNEFGAQLKKQFEQLMNLAVSGDVEAQYTVGSRCASGDPFHRMGAECELAEGVKWLRQAAAKGHVLANYDLGMYFRQHDNAAEAMRWFQVSADSGHAGSQYELGMLIVAADPDSVTALNWLEKAAGQKHARAAFEAGRIWHTRTARVSRGGRLVEPYAMAMTLYRQAATGGIDDAYRAIARMYALGQGVERDFEAATEWQNKASDSRRERSRPLR